MGGTKIIRYLSTVQVEDKLGVTRRRLHYWEKQSLIESTRVQGSKARHYDFMNLLQIKVIIKLREGGVSVQTIRRAVDRLRLDGERSDTLLVGLNLYTDGKEFYISDNGKMWNASTGQMVMFKYPFKDLIEETGKLVKKPQNYRKLTLGQLYQKSAVV